MSKYWDEAWNTVIGCTKCSIGCENCWAESLHNMRYEAYWAAGQLPNQYAKPFNEIQILEHRLDMLLHWRKPRTVFVNNMGDTFHPAVPFEFVGKMFSVIENCNVIWRGEGKCNHKFLLLTKRVQRMAKFAAQWYQDYFSEGMRPNDENIFWGTTICNQAEADKKIPILLQIPAAKRWLSIEPMLGEIDLRCIIGDPRRRCTYDCLRGQAASETRVIKDPVCGHVDWVVVGCESGPNRRPCKIEWIESIVEQCKAAGVKVYVKQVDLNSKVEKDINKFPQQLRQRDEI